MSLGRLCPRSFKSASPRTLNYNHYLFEAIPYACLSLGILLDAAWDDPRFRGLVRLYVAVALGLFAFFFPLLTALPIPTRLFYQILWDDHRPWMWFSGWI